MFCISDINGSLIGGKNPYPKSFLNVFTVTLETFVCIESEIWGDNSLPDI